MPSDDLLLVGRVARSHGNRGQVIINPETDFPEERFRPGEVVLVGFGDPPPRRTIREVRFQQGRPILALEGVNTIDEADALAGADVRMPASALGALPKGTFYRHDLIGCEIQDSAGRVVGRVVEVEGPMEQSRLVVAGPRGEVLIPLAADICIHVDPSERRIVINPPDGLLDLNDVT